MCILYLTNVLMCEFNYDNNSRLLLTDADSLMYEIKTESQDIIMIQKDLVVDKMKDESGGAANEEFVELNPKIYSYLVNYSSEHKKAKGVNKNVVATISHVLLNNKCLKHSMNRIQSKNHKIRTYEINKISLSFFHDKIYILNNVYDGLALGY